MTIKLQPQTQDDYNEWLKLGRRALTRKIYRDNIDDSAVVYALLEVRNSLPEGATDDDFTARALHSFVWYWGRIKEDTRGVETRRILKEVPVIRDYIKQRQQADDGIDIDDLKSFVRSKGYRVGREALLVACSAPTVIGAEVLENRPDTSDIPLKTIDEGIVTDCLTLYKRLYGDTVGLRGISKVFYSDVPCNKVDRQSLITSIEHLLAFIRYQLSQDTFNSIVEVLLNSNHKPERTYQEVFHV